MARDSIGSLSLQELEKELIRLGEPAYRGSQIFSWLYKRGISDFQQMYNIPLTLRKKLAQNYRIDNLVATQHLKSTDKTEKVLFKLQDDNYIETVLIPAKDRKTLCLSTQVGCKFNCAFCASGKKGFVRDLTTSEIIGQILYMQHRFKNKITNYVFMGMGEPLDNYENVVKAIMIMNDPKALAIGSRRITVSTCGIHPAIKKLKSLNLQINLAISLHAANDKKRNLLMPINKKYPLEELVSSCKDYIKKAGRMVTLEYILIKDVNDSIQDADNLSKIAKRLHAKINLIRYSVIPNLNYKPSEEKKTIIFMNRLLKDGVNATLRDSKGTDIQSACGQLACRIR